MSAPAGEHAAQAFQIVRHEVDESLRAAAAAFRNPRLRPLELALAASVSAEGAYAIGIAVYAYRHGGASAVGVVALLRLLVSAAASPFAAVVGDRYPRERVMLLTDLARAALLAAAAVAVSTAAPETFVYVLVVLVAAIGTAFWPAQAALVPSLADTAADLTSANAASSAIEGLGTFVGPGLAALVLVAGGVDWLFGVAAAAFAASAALVGIVQPFAAEYPAPRPGVIREALSGFGAIVGDSATRLVGGLFAAQMLVAGVLNVLVVVVALRLLDLGQSGVGYLNSAIGAGGLVGVVGAFALVARARLGAPLGCGIVLWGLPLALLAAAPTRATALILLAVAGAGNTLVDVAGFTLLQRAVPAAILARAFGSLESVLLAVTGIGAVLAPVLISTLGTRGALAATGAFLPVLAAALWTRLGVIDEAAAPPTDGLALLKTIPLFAPLPRPVLETLAGRLEHVRLPAGTTVFRQGERGDRLYVVRKGRVELEVEGKAFLTFGPGYYFGEIALLRRVPRTATVRARDDVELEALDGEAFVAAVSGNARSRSAADLVMSTRLAVIWRRSRRI